MLRIKGAYYFISISGSHHQDERKLMSSLFAFLSLDGRTIPFEKNRFLPFVFSMNSDDYKNDQI